VSDPVRVLVVDDQALVREGLMTLLEAAPGIAPVAAAADGEEALALCARHRPDVVLMDLRMPKLDGVEATRRIRETQPDIEIVVLTTHADAAGIARPAAPPKALPDELTPREAEVLSLIARGLSNAEIAQTLVVSEATVKSHINHLFAKIGARDRAQAVHYAYTNDLAG
jgi:DNA-binding NarL/FixJ family response regulator